MKRTLRFRLEGGGYFQAPKLSQPLQSRVFLAAQPFDYWQTGVLVASAEASPGGLPASVSVLNSRKHAKARMETSDIMLLGLRHGDTQHSSRLIDGPQLSCSNVLIDAGRAGL